jgi:hypothetical protein
MYGHNYKNLDLFESRHPTRGLAQKDWNTRHVAYWKPAKGVSFLAGINLIFLNEHTI